MGNVAPILHALASLLWPVFAFVALKAFKPEIARALGRLRKADLLGQHIELADELGTLHNSAVALEAQELPPKEGREIGPGEEEKFDATIDSILQQATSTPKVALMKLKVELEKLAQQGLATRGMLGGRSVVSLRQALSDLRQYGFPANLQGSLELFEDVRNKIIHGAAGTDDDALRALDSGMTILRALNSLPGAVNVVYHPGVEIFSDAMCTTLIPEAKGVILETTSPGGVMKAFQIFPTTRRHYHKGKRVGWEWNGHKVWPAAWYRDPDTGTIKRAWDQAAEFIGRPLDEISGAAETTEHEAR